MESFLHPCVDRYEELLGIQYHRSAATPFLSEKMAPDLSDGYDIGEDHSAAAEEAERKLQAAAELQPYATKAPIKSYSMLRAIRAWICLGLFVSLINLLEGATSPAIVEIVLPGPLY